MVIDLRDYEKFSGRKGDPMMRQGAALAKSSARKQELGASKGKNSLGHFMVAAWWYQFLIGCGVVVIVLIVAFIVDVF